MKKLYNITMNIWGSYKKIISITLLGLYLASGVYTSVIAETLEGHAEKIDSQPEYDTKLFTGQIQQLEQKDVIHMTVSQVIDGNITMEGDEFFAEVVNDVGESGTIIPKGTIAHGRISSSSGARRLGRDGYINLDFDYLVTPDGREIPIEGSMSTKLHPLQATAKIVATDVGYTAVGGAVGGFMALNLLGIEAAIASNGYTVMGGAAVGGAVGLGMALYRKGKDVLIAPGDEIKVKINTKIPLPVYRAEAFKQHEILFPGLTIKINNIIHEKDPFGEANTITLSVTISNMTKLTFTGMDFAMINDYNSITHPSIFGDTKLMFTTIKPGDRIAGRISFTVDNLNKNFWLTLYDRKNRKVITKISIDNAYKNVSAKTKKKNLKIKKKTNYYKEEDLFNL